MKQSLDKMYCGEPEPRALWVPRTLHEQMMVEAEPVVKSNWTDVAVHDKRKIENSPPFHYHLWIIYENGSYLAPLYCQLDSHGLDKHLAPAIHFLMRLQYNCSLFGVDVAAATYKFYFVQRTAGSRGKIVETNPHALIQLISEGKLVWSATGGFCYH